VKKIADRCDLVLIIGSRNSSNSARLVEVARACGTEAYLIDSVRELEQGWLEGKRTVGISSGASAPEHLVRELLDYFRERGVDQFEEVEATSEDVRFMLPKEMREALQSASA